MVESAAFYIENQAAAADPEGFDALWTAMGDELRLEASSNETTVERKTAAVRAHGEIAQHRILPHYHAARVYARAGMMDGGLFYLGSARAASKRVRLLAGFPDEVQGDGPGLSGLEKVEAELSELALDAYSRGDSAATHHRDFIRMDSALKEARELLRDGRRFGAAASLLEARLRLAVTTLPPGAAAELDRIPYRARLFDPNRDHSLARELWERALQAAASPAEDEQRLTAAIVSDVIPFYLERIAE
jgi:hypothetical protein